MPFEDYGTGQCINCGFLGKRGLGGLDSTCYHASARERATGQFERQDFETGLHTRTVPWCFVNIADLFREVQETATGRDHTVPTQEVITKARECKSWYPWREFVSPKEAWGDQVMLALEQRRREFEQRMERDRREYEQHMEQNRREFERGFRKFGIGIAIAAVILAVAQVGAAFLGLTSDSWVIRLFR